MRRFAAGIGLALLLGCSGSARAPRQPVPAPPAEAAAPLPELAAPATPAAPAPSTAPAEADLEPLAHRPAETRDLPLPAGPLRIRVGLASDLASLTLPCCDGEIAWEWEGKTLRVATPLVIEPAGASLLTVWRLQVAAVRDEERAAERAAELGERYRQPAEAHYDAGVDLYRVRLGRFPSRETAEAFRRSVAAQGLADAWLVSEPTGAVAGGLRVTHGGQIFQTKERSLTLAAAGAEGVLPFSGRRYRGRIVLYLNDRGTLNVINDLPLEDYLRGVVPKEMGPELYGRIEALKAQTVAARTYALRNRGGFAAEGYDICASPRCQVYGGRDAEHPLSDRAIRETAHQVLLYRGQLIDSLYTATCGGHTEDAEVVFPGKEAPYLRAVSCIEGTAPERKAKLASWSRFRTDRELAVRVEERYPGLGFSGFEILGRGRSGRVARLRLFGKGGAVREVEGLAVRWVLDLPETLFTARRLTQSTEGAGWQFNGRGWGHGVGMCQTGAYALAGRGLSYRNILAHYYQDSQLVRARQR